MSLTWVDGVAGDTIPADDRGLNYADGAFEIEEECLINEIRKAFDVSEVHFTMLQNWTKRLLDLEAEGAALLDLA